MTTENFMILTAVIWIVYDVYTIVRFGKHTSISANTIRWVEKNRKAFFLTLAFGIVLGHLFWSMKTEDVYPDVKCIKKKVLRDLQSRADKCIKL